MLKLLNSLFIIAVAASTSTCYAQSAKSTYEFVAGAKVIFSDDFNGDPVDSFPSKWRIAPCNERGATDYDSKKYWKIRSEGSERALAIYTSYRRIEPDLNSRFYLPDEFAVEFDFTYYKPTGSAQLYFYPKEHNDSCNAYRVHINIDGEISIDEWYYNHINNFSGTLAKHAAFKSNTWHHFAMAYRKRAIDFYIDRVYVGSVMDCRFEPSAFGLCCFSPVGYRHLRVTTTNEKYDFSKLFIGNKFVTHAILFDVNKSSVKNESMGFIKELAVFLANNPSVNLEIDGHTDSDGDAATNMKLSQARADEVKKQLVGLGIQNSRLTTRGLGDTNPLKPNATPEGKAENRRVEFIKK